MMECANQRRRLRFVLDCLMQRVLLRGGYFKKTLFLSNPRRYFTKRNLAATFRRVDSVFKERAFEGRDLTLELDDIATNCERHFLICHSAENYTTQGTALPCCFRIFISIGSLHLRGVILEPLPP